MLNKIKTLRKDSGFTIVELLIVIVVIGILAAITIVSYTGITQKANTTKAQTNAVAVQKVAEAYYAEKNTYPTVYANFTTGSSATLPSGIKFVTTVDSTNGTDSVSYVPYGSGAGAKITYRDFTGTASNKTIDVGNVTGAAGTAIVNP